MRMTKQLIAITCAMYGSLVFIGPALSLTWPLFYRSANTQLRPRPGSAGSHQKKQLLPMFLFKERNLPPSMLVLRPIMGCRLIG